MRRRGISTILAMPRLRWLKVGRRRCAAAVTSRNEGDHGPRVPTATAVARQRSPAANALIINYKYLRKAVGWIGILLPFVLLVGNIVISGELPGSVSGYYLHGDAERSRRGPLRSRRVLTAYAGYDELDRWITNLAGLVALGVAFFPTSHPFFHPKIIGDFHYFFAAASMISLALMALQFIKTAPGDKQTLHKELWRLLSALWVAELVPDDKPRKRMRNRIYRICAWAILVFVVLGEVQSFVPVSVKGNGPWLFIFEAAAIVAVVLGSNTRSFR
jgi:hypothetical protein